MRRNDQVFNRVRPAPVSSESDAQMYESGFGIQNNMGYSNQHHHNQLMSAAVNAAQTYVSLARASLGGGSSSSSSSSAVPGNNSETSASSSNSMMPAIISASGIQQIHLPGIVANILMTSRKSH